MSIKYWQYCTVVYFKDHLNPHIVYDLFLTYEKLLFCFSEFCITDFILQIFEVVSFFNIS